MRPPISGIAVVVPVHDEQELLGTCLASIKVALDHPRVRSLSSTIVVVLDQCSDASRDVAARHLREQDTVVDIASRNVGAARAAGCEVALTRLQSLGLSSASSWLGHTDADTRVPARWIAQHLRHAVAADAVAGLVRVDDWSQHPPGTADRFERIYEPVRSSQSVRSDRLGHSHVHGANLGVRGDSYLRAGGFPALRCSEDHALWNAIGRNGGSLVASRHLWVTTSGRRIGRAPGGFADTLATLSPS